MWLYLGYIVLNIEFNVNYLYYTFLNGIHYGRIKRGIFSIPDCKPRKRCK